MQQLAMFESEAKKVSRPVSSLIYEPKGRAREYAALALNLYRGCDHRCVYCYAPSIMQQSREQFARSRTRPDLLRNLDREAAKFERAKIKAQVHLCFTCDPYQALDVKEGVTREAIRILHRRGLNVCILTKGGRRALRDLDLFSENDAFATTLTLLDPGQSLKWEPGAALPSSRIETIEAFHEAGIPTWVSLEPVIDPAVSLEIIQRVHSFVDIFKVGQLNYHPHAKSINWGTWARDAVGLLTSLGYRRNLDPDTLQRGDFYIKHDLVRYLAQ